jgi:hypothetical protein
MKNIIEMYSAYISKQAKDLKNAGQPFLTSELEESNKITNKQRSSAIEQFASKAHEDWRKEYQAKNGNTPRIKKNSDGSEGDINVPFNKLHPDWKKENLAAGKAAHDSVMKYKNNREAAAEHIHNEWMKRNPKGDWNADQHVPYSELPEDEKQKDKDHYDTMKKILNQ